MTITGNQIVTIQTLITKLNLRAQKENIVMGFTGGSSSVKDLTKEQAAELINYLNSLNKVKNETVNTEDRKEKMVRHIFAMAHELGWIKKHTVITQSGPRQVKSYDAVHEWVKKYGYLHKPLNQYSYAELPTLVTAFKNMYNQKMGFKKSSKL